MALRHQHSAGPVVRGLALVLLLLVATLGSAMAQSFEEGRHYVAVSAPATMPSDHVVVTEAFAYMCPACRNFLPVISQWSQRQPDHVRVEHLPVALQAGWEVFVRAYYTMQALNLPQQAHQDLFFALHDQRRPLRSVADIGAFLANGYDITAETFVSTADSFAVESMMGRNRNEVRRFGVRSTPSIIVHGKWRMNLNAFDSYDQMMLAVDMLVAREAAALGLGDDATQ